jgi:hypothetical protein
MAARKAGPPPLPPPLPVTHPAHPHFHRHAHHYARVGHLAAADRVRREANAAHRRGEFAAHPLLTHPASTLYGR